MSLKSRIFKIIFSFIIFSPVFFTVGDNYHIYTNRIYHFLVYFFDEQKIIYIGDTDIKFLFTIPLNLIALTILGIFFIKELLKSKTILLISIYLLLVIILNFDYFSIFYKNSISILVGISSIILFNAYFKKNNNFLYNDVLIYPILIVIFGFLINLYLNFKSYLLDEIVTNYSNQLYYYFFPQLLIFNALQYFAFIFLVFVSLRYENKFYLIFIYIITAYICLNTENFTATLLFITFSLFRLLYFFLNSKYKDILLNISIVVIISSLFLYYFFFLIVPFDLLPLSIKDRYLILFDFISKLDMHTIFIPMHDDYSHLTNGLHNTFLEIFSRFGLIFSILYVLIILNQIKHLKSKEPMLYIMMLLLIFVASSLTTYICIHML